MPICLFIPPATQEPSPCLCRNPIYIWRLAWGTICRGYSLRVHHALIAELVTNRASGRVRGTEYVGVSAVSVSLALYNYSLRETSLAAFAIFRGRYQESPSAHQMSSAQMTLHRLPFEVERQPEASIRLSRTSYPSHGSSRPRLPSLLASIR